MKGHKCVFLSVPCPICGAKEGVGCRGNVSFGSHTQRLDIYRQTPQYRETIKKKFNSLQLNKCKFPKCNKRTYSDPKYCWYHKKLTKVQRKDKAPEVVNVCRFKGCLGDARVGFAYCNYHRKNLVDGEKTA